MEAVTRVCLLTGASGVLGRAFMARYAPEYCFIAVAHRQPILGARDFATECPTAPGPGVWGITADLVWPEEVQQLAHRVVERVGAVDCVIHSAAIRRWSPLSAPKVLEGAGRMMQVNILAPLRLAVALTQQGWQDDPERNRQRNRHVLMVSSTAGLRVYPQLGQGMYSMTKAALNQLTEHMAHDFAPLGIRVNAVCPDSFPTRVSTEAVVEEMRALEMDKATGAIVPVLGPRGFEP